MKVLSLTQPWASLMALDAKRIETRSWQTSYRGPLAIHVAKSFPAWARQQFLLPYFRDVFEAAGMVKKEGSRFSLTLPIGEILAIGRLVDIVETDLISIGTALQPGEMRRYQYGIRISGQEFAFGSYEAGRFAWIFEDLKPLPEPIPAKGKLGLWEFPGLEVPA